MLAALLAILGSMVALGAGGGGGSSSRDSSPDTTRQSASKKEATDERDNDKGDVVLPKPPKEEPPEEEPPVVKPPKPPKEEPPVVEPPVVEPPVVEPPVVEPPVVEPPVVEPPVVEPPTTGGQDTDSSGGEIPPTDVTSNFSVAGGRVTTLQINNHENLESIRILSDPSHGNLTINPDNTLALVLSHEPDFAGRINFTYEATYSDNTTEVHDSRVTVETTTQQEGWGQGNFYMLEEDENGDVVVEHGDNHREVYVSGSQDALSLSDIADLEGLNTSQITRSWLASHTDYGSNPNMALDAEAGMQLWNGITGEDSPPSSNWLLFERGYEYSDLGGVIDRGTVGESPLHPVHVTAYGEGDRPVLDAAIGVYGDSNQNIVFSGLSVTKGISAIEAENLIFDDMDITNDNGMGIYVSRSDNISLHDSSVIDAYRVTPPSGDDSWTGGEHASGLFAGRIDGLLVEGTFFDHNGWAPDYQEDLSADGGQPPNVFSHNVYIDWQNTDVTFRDNISMRGSSIGSMVRSGGYIENNVYLDNNVAVNFLGGDYEGRGPVGNYTLFSDNVITSAGHLGNSGAMSQGIHNKGVDTTLIDNIVSHLADPNNHDELADKPITHDPLYNEKTALYDDTIIYNWLGQNGVDRGRVSDDQNIEGLDTSVLDATTIQNFAQQLLGDSNAGISELADFLRAQAAGALDDYVDADLIIDFFQTGFGLSVEDRLTPETLRFIPNELGDGIRWDNRLNWNTDDLPGTMVGDSVDLGGNWVNYGGTTAIEDLDFGEGGTLNVSHGSLTINDHTAVGEAGGDLNVSFAGQVWMDGYTDLDELDINVDGGRFANTGLFVGNADIDITDGQAILATDGADMILRDNTELEIIGDDAKAGFDGATNGTGVLMMADGAQLTFTSQNGEGLSTIEEFRSGHFGDDPNIQSGVNLGNASLELNLANLSGAGTHSLINVDELIGEFGEINVTGLGGRDASVTIDYDTDEVFMTLASGSGNVSFNTIGDQNNAQASDELWAALTNGHGIYPDDPANDIPQEEDDVDEAA